VSFSNIQVNIRFGASTPLSEAYPFGLKPNSSIYHSFVPTIAINIPQADCLH
jgi:hypothetical protein